MSVFLEDIIMDGIKRVPPLWLSVIVTVNAWSDILLLLNIISQP